MMRDAFRFCMGQGRRFDLCGLLESGSRQRVHMAWQSLSSNATTRYVVRPCTGLLAGYCRFDRVVGCKARASRLLTRGASRSLLPAPGSLCWHVIAAAGNGGSIGQGPGWLQGACAPAVNLQNPHVIRLMLFHQQWRQTSRPPACDILGCARRKYRQPQSPSAPPIYARCTGE